MFLTSATCRLSNLKKLPSTTEHQSWFRTHKIWRYAWYLWNFDRPLELPRYLWCFWRWQCVIFSKNYGASPWQLLLPSAMVHQSPPSSCCHFAEYPVLGKYVSPSILRNTILHNTNTHHQKGQQIEAVDTWNPSRKVISMGDACDKKGQCVLFVCYSCVWYDSNLWYSIYIYIYSIIITSTTTMQYFSSQQISQVLYNITLIFYNKIDHYYLLLTVILFIS